MPDYMPPFPQSNSDLTHHHFFLPLPVIIVHSPTHFLHVVVALRPSPVPVRDHAAPPPPLLLKQSDASPGASPSRYPPSLVLDPRAPRGPTGPRFYRIVSRGRG
ncbi:hypothetical protein CGRA01v4_06325 [Colletotrichum graminicola]|nr:hypothetical protein CGRA01v4_06325 [Colletotrichum graminicola]